jgi:23S rRNA (cytidine2498-2'-O)-methyltransferase
MSAQQGWLAYCRAGFEAECAEELAAYESQAPIETGQGWVWLQTDEPMPDLGDLIFARQILQTLAEVRAEPRDRLTPVLAELAKVREKFANVFVETPDTNDGRGLSSFATNFAEILTGAMTEHGWLVNNPGTRPRYAKRGAATQVLHVFAVSSERLLLAHRDHRLGSPWPMGIPRLRLPGDAPSRSAAKIAEAFHVLLGDQETERLLVPGRRAVDLGAAPGGWSWWLAQRGMRVLAVDNGPMAATALDTGMVDHLRADGFRYRPQGRVDWVVCDMVEQPARIARLMGDWLADGAASHALFNLKLPMKKRREEVIRNLDTLAKRLDRAGISAQWGVKHLYHDREEVTVMIVRD